ncbi:MAG: hypothetical protein KF832_01495 [Caldilineaceae bacterium]|nr:hypothetical protein [Caldilineaceae bacterium]
MIRRLSRVQPVGDGLRKQPLPLCLSAGWGCLWQRAQLGVICALLLLFAAPPPAQAQSGISSPASGSALSGDVPIIGTSVIENFQRYELYYKLEPSGDDAYIYFDGGTNQVTGGQLAIWRTANFAPGTYSLRLRVVKTDGNYGEFYARDLVVNQVGAEQTPTPTPTETPGEPTATPIPTVTFTPAPQPTPIVGQVTQPQVEGDTPTATETTVSLVAAVTSTAGLTDTVASTGSVDSLFNTGQSSTEPLAANTSFTRELGEAVALDRLRSFFLTGIRLSATLILGGVVLLIGKRLFGWVWTQYR